MSAPQKKETIPQQDAVFILSDILKRDAIASRAEMHSWEQQLVKTWEEVAEDQEGRLLVDEGLDAAIAAKTALETEYTRTRGARDAVVQKGLIRNLVIIIDLSSASAIKEDKRLTRKQILFEALDVFIDDFFAQNPVSQLCLIAAGARATKITLLSGSPLEQKRRLHAFDCLNESLSLQNALTVAAATLSHVPTHGSREVLVAMSALGTTDPGDIEATTLLLRRERIRVSFLVLSAEVYITKHIAQQTGGQFIVSQSPAHTREALLSFVAPPLLKEAKRLGADSTEAKDGSEHEPSQPQSEENMRRFARRWVRVGFPNRETTTGMINASFLAAQSQSQSQSTTQQKQTQIALPVNVDTISELYCSCHFSPIKEGYRCPRCQALVCELPTTCCGCSISLVASPQLARSYHHLFPVPSFSVFELPKLKKEHSVPPQEDKANQKHIFKMKLGVREESTEDEQQRKKVKTEQTQTPSITSITITRSVRTDDGMLQKAEPLQLQTQVPQTQTQKQTQAQAQTQTLPVQKDLTQNSELDSKKIDINSKSNFPPDLQFRCFGCKVHIKTTTELVTVCPDCALPFCLDCDTYIHLSLHNCPGCLSSSERVRTTRLAMVSDFSSQSFK